MHYLNTLAVFTLAFAATGTLAVPTDTSCSYEPDHVHVTCLGANENYPRGVDVTYDLGKRFDAEMFLRRSDALETMKRGMDEQRVTLKRDANVIVDATGDLSKTMIDFHNGTTKPLSDLVGPAGKVTVDKKSRTSVADHSSDHSSSSSTTVSNNGKNVTTKADAGNGKGASDNSVSHSVVNLGNGCTVAKNGDSHATTCSIHNVRRTQMRSRSTYGPSYGGGSANNNLCNFGSGVVVEARDNVNGGASVSCTNNGNPTFARRQDGESHDNYCNFGNGNSYVGKRDGKGASVECDRASTSNPTFGPSAGATVVGAENLRRRDDDQDADGTHCVWDNAGSNTSGKRNAATGLYRRCTATTSPLYGPNGGYTTIIAPSAKRSFDLSNVDDVLAYHNEVRGLMASADTSFKRDSQPCDGVPVGPVGPVANYVTRRGMPIELDGDLPTQPTPSVHLYGGDVVRPGKPTPLAATPVRRCVNTPIAPVGPQVHYESKAQYESEHGGS